MTYWAFCLVVGIGVLAYQVLSGTRATTIARKNFHFLAVLVYIPGLVWQPTFLYLASGVIMGLFMMLEVGFLYAYQITRVVVVERMFRSH